MTGRTLFLHVGLPKCASSALQDWADANRTALAAQGLDWPDPTPAGLVTARHQWLVGALRVDGDMARLSSELAAAPGDILISAEGLSLQFEDFPEQHLAAFRNATLGWSVRLILMTRGMTAWQHSMWKQCMINPQRPDAGFGLPLDLADFSKLPRIQRLTALPRLKDALARGYGARDLTEIDVEGNWAAALAGLLDIDMTGLAQPIRRNESIPATATDVVRAINAEGLDGGPRDGLLALMQLALETGNDTLRELVRAREPGAVGDLPELRAALGRIAARLGAGTANTLTLEAMDVRLTELEQEAAQWTG